MAIAPPSDIVLDVARAADPLRYDAAVRKLTQAALPEDVGAAFAEVLEETADTAGPFEGRASPMLAGLRGRLDPFEHLAPAGAGAEPYRKFEAFVLQSFIQSMFPKDASHVFGGGIAGEYWSSMLAEEIANQVAAAGGIGIAAEVAGRHPGGTSFDRPQLERPRAGRVHDALAALPGYVTSLELAFADEVMPGAGKEEREDG